MINEQLRFLLPKAMLADLLIFVAALPFYGLNIQIPLGLLLGTAAMTASRGARNGKKRQTIYVQLLSYQADCYGGGAGAGLQI